MSSDDRRRESGSNFSSHATAAGGVGYSSFVARNMTLQEQALRGGTVDLSTRLGAMLPMSQFSPSQVGGGAYPGIRAIHSLMGDIGQSNIGSLFNSPEAMHLASQPIQSGANRGLGQLEHSFWRTRMNGIGASGAASIGERFGGVIGSAFVPDVRAGIQAGFASLSATFPRAAVRAPGAAAVLGGLYVAGRAEWKNMSENKR